MSIIGCNYEYTHFHEFCNERTNEGRNLCDHHYIERLKEVLEMVVDNTKMPHKHEDLQTRLYCLAERAREILEDAR